MSTEIKNHVADYLDHLANCMRAQIAVPRPHRTDNCDMRISRADAEAVQQAADLLRVGSEAVPLGGGDVGCEAHNVSNCDACRDWSGQAPGEGSKGAWDHPAHYGGKDNPYEAIKVIEAWGLGFCLGNTLKYIARHEHKGATIEDLKKARWYLEREIQARENDDGQ